MSDFLIVAAETMKDKADREASAGMRSAAVSYKAAASKYRQAAAKFPDKKELPNKSSNSPAKATSAKSRIPPCLLKNPLFPFTAFTAFIDRSPHIHTQVFPKRNRIFLRGLR